ncbi:MAG: acyl-CoA dehydrogenase family protein [Desulfobulbaceae bacterium]|jgi:alkylation response protein AidB-like acyl-CoA dehydrogenase|nr:acyl-CoA dehydrogenase family protein [Desulfobulbaceae bacterium]
MSNLPKGGIFFFENTKPEDVFTPEDFNDEHKMIAESMEHFMAETVFPNLSELDETKNSEILKKMIREAGELGFLGMDIPERFGGTEVDEISTTIIAEKVGAAGSFSLGHGGQTGIGNLPIVYFGNEAQKAKYLPGIASGEKFSAYALTEPGAGSDALGAQTKAILSEDGKYYILNGSKTFITNAGFADTFIVFAKIDGAQFSGFVVEAKSEGLTTGADEHKMGMKGSSTRTIFFDNVKVPVENLLFAPGKGAAIAFGILNIGRHKVSANSMGASKLALSESASYANERKQFKTPIANFGMIKEKLAEMAVRTYAAESLIYRTGGLLMNILHGVDKGAAESGPAIVAAVEEYAIECSLEKVFCTEQEAFVTDEGVQIHGGYGYIAEYTVERLYRDARIRRIFEGTNEINRTVIASMLARRAAKGDLPLVDAAKAVQKKAAAAAAVRAGLEDMVAMAKEVFLYIRGAASDTYADKLMGQQEIVGRLADLAIYAYACETALVRARKYEAKKGAGAKHMLNMATVFLYASAEKLKAIARESLCAMAEGDGLAAKLAELDTLTRYTPVNLIALRGEIAAKISEAGKYVV